MALVLGPSTLINSTATTGINIDTSGYVTIPSKRYGMGTFTAENRDLQFITWTGTKANGVTTLMTEVSMNENGHIGWMGLSMVTGGLGTTRLYQFTGRYAQTALTMVQGGNRGAGEDANLAYLGGSNTIGFTLTSSGYSGSVPYTVWAAIGIQNQDRWMTD
jgi:hypothetical protein